MSQLRDSMKSWSRYNTLFQSGRYGWHLHNALSGLLLELDEPHRRIVESLSQHLPYADVPPDNEFLALLEEHGVLSVPNEEKLKLMELRYLRNAACFSTSNLTLTICPTLACNFACPYCFEDSQDDATVMDEQTIEALLDFIGKHQGTRHLSVSWYGGEPTLAFNVIENLTKKFIALFPDYADAGIITNGYLLDQTRIDRLDDLRISSVQVTLDGNAATHDQRRCLKNGGATYERILANIDLLMASTWQGRCSLRVNVDRTNRLEYAALQQSLLERYKGKNLTVYPGHINTFEGHPYSQECGLCVAEWSAFQLEEYWNRGTIPRGGFYPRSDAQNSCIATSHQGYVVGPGGELYKCWEDVGRQEMVVGSVHAEPFLTNPALLTRYTIGTDPHNDSECLECKVFPCCGGGCVNKRMHVLQFGEGSLEYCSPLKKSLESYLEAYLDVWHTARICQALLNLGPTSSRQPGYRVISPAALHAGSHTRAEAT